MVTRVDNRWKAILGMSSDHAGINVGLGRLRTELYRVLARINEPRHVRYYFERMREASREWLREYESAQPKR